MLGFPQLHLLQSRCDAFALAASENSIVGLRNVKSIMDLGRPRSATPRSVAEDPSARESGVHCRPGSDNDRVGARELCANPIAGCSPGRLYSSCDLASGVGCERERLFRSAWARCDA